MASRKNMIPIIGAPHMKAILRGYRRGMPTNFSKGIKDFIDNIILHAGCNNINIRLIWDESASNKGTITKIIISDDYENGFEKIYETGIDNPLNFGHIRDGHTCDGETSEFGAGMKIAAARNSNEFTIITRCVTKTGISYQIITYDFTEMENREDAIESHQPDFDEISQERYEKKHMYTQGSTICLSNLTNEGRNLTNNIELFEKELRYKISESYSDNLCKKITLNGKSIESYPLKKSIIEQDPLCNNRAIKHEVNLFVDAAGVIVECLAVRTSNNKTTGKEWDKDKQKFKKISENYLSMIKDNKSKYTTLTFVHWATNVQNTSIDKKFLRTDKLPYPYKETRVTYEFSDLNQRSYGTMITHPVRHQSNSCAYAEIFYSTKQMNRLLGLTIDKEINPNAENMELRRILKDLLTGKDVSNPSKLVPESTPSKPTPSKPTPSKPTPSKPTPSKPTPSKPTPVKPTPVKPTPVKPATPPSKPAAPPSKPAAPPSKPDTPPPGCRPRPPRSPPPGCRPRPPRSPPPSKPDTPPSKPDTPPSKPDAPPSKPTPISKTPDVTFEKDDLEIWKTEVMDGIKQLINKCNNGADFAKKYISDTINSL